MCTHSYNIIRVYGTEYLDTVLNLYGQIILLCFKMTLSVKINRKIMLKSLYLAVRDTEKIVREVTPMTCLMSRFVQLRISLKVHCT